VADTGGHDLHQDFTGPGAVQVDFGDFQWLAGGDCDGGSGFHALLLVRMDMQTVACAGGAANGDLRIRPVFFSGLAEVP
jgi:hypothetical protein